MPGEAWHGEATQGVFMRMREVIARWRRIEKDEREREAKAMSEVLKLPDNGLDGLQEWCRASGAIFCKYGFRNMVPLKYRPKEYKLRDRG